MAWEAKRRGKNGKETETRRESKKAEAGAKPIRKAA